MGKAVFLLHGFLSNPSDFDEILEILERHYDHIEKITFPGHKEEESYKLFTPEETLRVTLEAFDNLQEKYDNIDVMGFSMGGAIAVYLSQVRSFNKLILFAPANKYFNFKIPFEKFITYIKEYSKYFIAKIQKNGEEEEDTKELLDGLISDDIDSVKLGFTNFFNTHFYGTYRNFRRLIITINNNVEDIKNPCFISWGELDQLVPIESVEELYDKCTSNIKQKHIYPYLTHLLLMSELNDDLMSDLEAFLKIEI